MNLENALSSLTWAMKPERINLEGKNQGEYIGAVGKAQCMKCHAIATMRG